MVHRIDSVLGEVLDLLETYRTALRSSKSRQCPEDDPNQIITVYYRMHANVAESLVTLLPSLVRPESWKTAARPQAAGEVVFVPSAPDLSNVKAATETKQPARTLVIARAVLIIRQTRAAHDEIEEVIHRIEFGDPKMHGGMGGMGGGFGGGFFSVPSDNASMQSK